MNGNKKTQTKTGRNTGPQRKINQNISPHIIHKRKKGTKKSNIKIGRKKKK